MTQPTTPVAEARVLAALAVLRWPDDRADQYAKGALYRYAEDAIRAADTAQPEELARVIAERDRALADVTRLKDHLANAHTERDRAIRQLAQARVLPHALTAQIERYADQLRADAQAVDDGVAVGLLRAADGLGDLITAGPGHDEQCTPPLCAACGCRCHDQEATAAPEVTR